MAKLALLRGLVGAISLMAFALVVAYLCSKEYSPKAIMQDLKPVFPSRP